MKSFLSVFMAGLMAAGAFPAPRLWAEDAAPPKNLRETLTSQEQSLYVALREAGDAGFNAEDLVKPAAPALLAAWRTALKARAEAYLRADPAPAALKGKPAAEQITALEKTYIAGRMAAAGLSGDQPLLDLLALAAEGESADALIRNIRDLIRKDLDAYAKKPGEENASEAVMSWAKTALVGTLDLAKANEAAAAALRSEPQERPREDTPEPDALQTAIAAVFSDKVEAAVVEHVARKQGVAEWTQKLTAIAADEDAGAVEAIRMLARRSIEEHLRTDGKPSVPVLEGLGATLTRLKVAGTETLAYFCRWAFPDGTARAVEPGASSTPSPKKQLEMWTDRTLWAAGTARDEAVKSGADFIMAANDPLPGRCQNHFNSDKFNEAAKHFPDSTPRHSPNLANGEIPSPHPTQAAEDIKAEGEPEKTEIPWRSIAIGAAAGALAFGILGMLFAGPVGALVGAAIGGLFYGGVVALHHEVI